MMGLWNNASFFPKSFIKSSTNLYRLQIIFGFILISQAAHFGFGKPVEEKVSIAPPMEWVHRIDWDRKALQDKLPVDVGMRYLLVDSQKHSGVAESYVHYVEQMVNEHGVQECGTLSFTFDPSYQELVLHRIQLHRDGQVINKLERSALNIIQPEKELDWDIYSGDHSVTLFLEDLRVGDVLEYDYTLRGRNPVSMNHFWTRFYLQRSRPVREQFYRLVLPKEMPLRQRYHNADWQPVVTDSGMWRDYRWEIPSQDALLIEDSTPYTYDPYIYIEFSNFASWSDVVQWGLNLYPDVSNKPIDEIRTLVSGWQADYKTPEERALAALQFVQDELRYLGIEFGPYSFQPLHPAEVLERRFGDCKDKAYLLCTLLRAMGIQAWPALVDPGSRKGVADCLPSPFVFSHVIVKMRIGDREIWIDPTLTHQGGSIDNRFLPPYSLALVIQPGRQDLESIPFIQPTQAQEAVLETYTIQDDPDPVRLTVETTYRYGNADQMRQILADTDRTQLAKDYLNYYTRLHADIEQTKPLEIVDNLETNELKVTEEYQIREFWETGEDNSRWTYGVFYPYSLESLLTDPRTRLRQMPLYIPFPLHRTHYFIVHMPERCEVTGESSQITHDAFQMDYRERLEGQTIHFEYELATLKGEVPPSQVPDYLEQLEEMQNSLSSYIERPNANYEFSLGQINWVMLAIAFIYSLSLAAGLIWIGFTKRFRTSPGQLHLDTGGLISMGLAEQNRPASQTTPITPYPDLRGIGGWLILVAIGICLSPLSLIFTFLLTTPIYFDNAVWGERAIPQGDNFHPLFGPLLMFEIVGNLTVIGFSILLVYLFFAKRALFPKVYVAFAVATLGFLIIDEALGHLIPNIAEENDPGNIPAIGRSLLQCLIWCPYMLLSKRVKATFVN